MKSFTEDMSLTLFLRNELKYLQLKSYLPNFIYNYNTKINSIYIPVFENPGYYAFYSSKRIFFFIMSVVVFYLFWLTNFEIRCTKKFFEFQKSNFLYMN